MNCGRLSVIAKPNDGEGTLKTGAWSREGIISMQIWVDADACPGEIKELLFRAAVRRKVKVTLVANQSMRVPTSEFIETVLVPYGANIADRQIVELLSPDDLVVTADIP